MSACMSPFPGRPDWARSTGSDHPLEAGGQSGLPSALNWTTRDRPWSPRQMLWMNLLGPLGDGGVGLRLGGGGAVVGRGGTEVDGVGREDTPGPAGRSATG